MPNLKRQLNQFFAHRTPQAIAQDLLGRQLTFDGPNGKVGGLIVETEAYGGSEDSTSYASSEHITKKSRPLYGEPGTIYIYKIHARWVMGIVDQIKGTPSGIMLRAIEPTIGTEIMEQNRKQHGKNLTNGPAKFIEALGINNQYNLNLCNQGPIQIDLNHKHQAEISKSPRIGVAVGPNQMDEFRFFVTGNPYVSGIKQKSVLPNHGWRNY